MMILQPRSKKPGELSAQGRGLCGDEFIQRHASCGRCLEPANGGAER